MNEGGGFGATYGCRTKHRSLSLAIVHTIWRREHADLARTQQAPLQHLSRTALQLRARERGPVSPRGAKFGERATMFFGGHNDANLSAANVEPNTGDMEWLWRRRLAWSNMPQWSPSPKLSPAEWSMAPPMA